MAIGGPATSLKLMIHLTKTIHQSYEIEESPEVVDAHQTQHMYRA